MNPANARAHERVPLSVAVDLESEHNFYAGITNNISEGGLFVATAVPPPLGAVAEIHLTLPGEPNPFAIRGVVRWLRDAAQSNEDAPVGCGVQWLEMSRDAFNAIRAFVTQRDTLFVDTDDETT